MTFKKKFLNESIVYCWDFLFKKVFSWTHKFLNELKRLFIVIRKLFSVQKVFQNLEIHSRCFFFLLFKKMGIFGIKWFGSALRSMNDHSLFTIFIYLSNAEILNLSVKTIKMFILSVNWGQLSWNRTRDLSVVRVIFKPLKLRKL